VGQDRGILEISKKGNLCPLKIRGNTPHVGETRPPWGCCKSSRFFGAAGPPPRRGNVKGDENQLRLDESSAGNQNRKSSKEDQLGVLEPFEMKRKKENITISEFENRNTQIET